MPVGTLPCQEIPDVGAGIYILILFARGNRNNKGIMQERYLFDQPGQAMFSGVFIGEDKKTALFEPSELNEIIQDIINILSDINRVKS
jgi:hypothetical protein